MFLANNFPADWQVLFDQTSIGWFRQSRCLTLNYWKRQVLEQELFYRKKHLPFRILCNNTYVGNERADLTWLDGKAPLRESWLCQCRSFECRIGHRFVAQLTIHGVFLLREDRRSSPLFDRFFFCVLLPLFLVLLLFGERPYYLQPHQKIGLTDQSLVNPVFLWNDQKNDP